MKKLFAVCALLLATQASAAVVTFQLKDIGTFSDFATSDTSLIFTGNGFAGMYVDQWVHILGLEKSDESRTAMQVGIGYLLGKDIYSARLSFDLTEGEPGVQTSVLTGFKGNGQLAFQWNAPNANYGSVSAPTETEGVNSCDVTALLEASVQAGDTWFGMHLRGSELYQWTETDDIDSLANMVLTVEYGALPEPASLALVGLGLGMLAMAACRRRA